MFLSAIYLAGMKKRFHRTLAWELKSCSKGPKESLLFLFLRFNHTSSEGPFGLDPMHDLKIGILKVIWKSLVVHKSVVKPKFFKRLQKMYKPIKMSGKIEWGHMWSQGVQIILIHKFKIRICKTLVPFYSWFGSVRSLCAVVIFITACHSAYRERI